MSKAKQMGLRNALQRAESEVPHKGNGGIKNERQNTIYCKACASRQPFTKSDLYRTNRDGVPLANYQCLTCHNGWIGKDFKRTEVTLGDVLFKTYAEGEKVKSMDKETFDILTSVGIAPISERRYMEMRGLRRHPEASDQIVSVRPVHVEAENFTIICARCGHAHTTFYEITEFMCAECGWYSKENPAGKDYLYAL